MSEKDRPKPPQGSQPTAGTPQTDEAADARTEDPMVLIVTGADVEAAMRGQEFPASTRDLMDRARQNGADEGVFQRLADLPDRRFTSLGDTLRALDMLS